MHDHAKYTPFNSLFEMRRSGAIMAETLSGTFNSLFEMLVLSQTGVDNLEVTFNSLFEMPRRLSAWRRP